MNQPVGDKVRQLCEDVVAKRQGFYKRFGSRCGDEFAVSLGRVEAEFGFVLALLDILEEAGIEGCDALRQKVLTHSVREYLAATKPGSYLEGF